jgi:hypothetical protein
MNCLHCASEQGELLEMHPSDHIMLAVGCIVIILFTLFFIFYTGPTMSYDCIYYNCTQDINNNNTNFTSLNRTAC